MTVLCGSPDAPGGVPLGFQFGIHGCDYPDCLCYVPKRRRALSAWQIDAERLLEEWGMWVEYHKLHRLAQQREERNNA